MNVAEFIRQAREYSRRVVDYVERKKAFSPLRYFTTMPESRVVDMADPEELRNT